MLVKKKLLSGILTIAMTLAFVVSFVPSEVHGTTSVSISGGDDVNVGDEFTISVEFTGDDTARVEGQIGYDENVLKYISGGKTGGGGFVDLSNSGSDGTVVFDIKFKAIDGGTTGIDVSSSAIYDNNKNQIDNCASTKVIKIAGAADSGNDEAVHDSSTIPATNEDTEQGNTFSMGKVLGIGAAAFVVIIVLILIAVKRKKAKKQ